MQALLLGNCNNFQQEESSFILNLFAISTDFPSSPLLKLSILKILIDKAGTADEASGYMPLSQVLLYCGSMGVSEEATLDALRALMDYRLVEPFDASSDELVGEQRLAITHSGRVHYEMATNDEIYLGQMAFATPVRSENIVARLRTIRSRRMGNAEWTEVRRVFVLYCFIEDRSFVRIPKDIMFDGQRQLRTDLFGRWVRDGQRAQDPQVREKTDDGDTFPPSNTSAISPANHLATTVKWFDPARGYGFLDGGLGRDIFVHISQVTRAGLAAVTEGDQITCDVGVSSDGRPQVTQIHSVEPTAEKVAPVAATVVFFNPTKGYGFVAIGDGGEDAYLSAKVVRQGGCSSFANGQQVNVLVGASALGRGRVVIKN